MLVRRPLRSREAGVPDALAVSSPGDAPTGGGILDAGDDRLYFLVAGDIEDVERAILTATKRHGYSDRFPIGRWNEPVYGGRPCRVQAVGVHDDDCRGWVDVTD